MTRSLRRVFRFAAAIALAGGAALLLGGCSTTIVPPASVEQPQAVFVLDHGRHSSLVLPHPDGFVRYAYGDWGWYAEVETGVAEASRAVLLPTRAGLGRSVTGRSATAGEVRAGLKVGIQELHEIQVETARVDALRSSLEGLYQDHFASLKYNAVYDLAFVEHPETYAFWNNSNHKVAEWLRRLGCAIEGSALWAWWKVTGADGVKAPR
ncbi:hypothetical protein SR882_07885 [Guyparkeria halophila]|uniref:DUF2459 domain-containing protein n=1 Tax=Guyparkeria halophila TaxID=47960 RepID=A0ABZ0YUK8_9GAMM|nr:hypothetical protein [Guyparkeria halophila]WQH15683.1 hypothetical protein SR882_07885 [Guyparkeria halophila]